MRGKHVHNGRTKRHKGLIPACAGKTATASVIWERISAHPRVCGENLPAKDKPRRWPGSSPRVRGKRTPIPSTVKPSRLIPACAGKTKPVSTDIRAARAHPRVCGENNGFCGCGLVDQGSSPRVRGKRGQDGVDGLSAGLIPACAGKTRFAFSIGPRTPAHPRVCGENVPVNG